MCDCIKSITDATMIMAVDRNEGGVLHGEILGTHWPIINNIIKPRQTLSVFQYAFVPIKKDGIEGKQKKKTINIAHIYCPFCGKKHNND